MASIEGRVDLPDYSACVVSVHAHGTEGSTRLANPVWDLIGGRLYLVGKVAGSLERVDALAGCENAVAWDQVDDFLVFRSTEEYERRMFPDVQKRDRLVCIDALRS